MLSNIEQDYYTIQQIQRKYPFVTSLFMHSLREIGALVYYRVTYSSLLYEKTSTDKVLRYFQKIVK